VEPLWDQIVAHLLELADNSNPQVRNLALDALDQSICAVLGSDEFQGIKASQQLPDSHVSIIIIFFRMSLLLSIVN
ncbi:hypothetical protein MUK42_14902, partial [Musa troglodytarum]